MNLNAMLEELVQEEEAAAFVAAVDCYKEYSRWLRRQPFIVRLIEKVLPFKSILTKEQLAMIDIKAVQAEAAKQIAEEETKKAKDALVSKMRALASARKVVKNLEREIEDLQESIADGSFTG